MRDLCAIGSGPAWPNRAWHGPRLHAKLRAQRVALLYYYSMQTGQGNTRECYIMVTLSPILAPSEVLNFTTSHLLSKWNIHGPIR
jgi:hypothetical protein